MPALINQTRKGQKTLLGDAISLGKIKACLGWNVKNPACDVDVSAFLLGLYFTGKKKVRIAV